MVTVLVGHVQIVAIAGIVMQVEAVACAPPTNSKIVNKVLSLHKARPKASAGYIGQCKALTKKRSRCKRAGTGTGYCWQHKK